MTSQEFINRVLTESSLAQPPRKASYGERLSQFITVGVDHVTSPDTQEISLMSDMIRLFDKAREIYGRPIPITAGFRTHAHEEALTRSGYKTAKFVSPHSLGAALDLDSRPYTWRTEAQVNAEIRQSVQQAAKALALPRPRLGHRAYDEKFTHVDLVFMLFQPYTTLPHPAAWQELDEGTRKALSAGWREGVEW